MSNVILARMRSLRQRWIELEPGRRVQIIRPLEVDVQDFISRSEQTEVDRMHNCAVKYVTGWEGFTESFLLGADQAAADPVPFDSDLWAEVVRDHADWLVKVTRALMEEMAKHGKERDDAGKNSQPS